jgi:hypothetical protein
MTLRRFLYRKNRVRVWLDIIKYNILTMRKIFITVAAFLLLLEAGCTKIQHEHVHYELPEWEVIATMTVRASGDTSTGFSCY